MMRTAAFLQGAWALLLFAAAGGAGRPTGAEGLPGAGPGASPHDREHHLPQVTSITFSPDGRRLVASYYVLAMNRPGTDWQCWTAQWNLETGQRLIIPDTCAPVTFHPDGATMAMGFYERSGKPARLSAPARLALWKPGADLPARGLKPPKDDQSSVLAATFNLNGDRLLAMTAAGGLLAWHTRKDEPPEILDKVKRDVQPPGRWGLPRPKMALSQGDVLLAAFPPSPGRAEGWAVSWRYARSSSRPDAYALERLKTYEGGLITWDARAVTVMGRLPRKGWAYSFACEKAEAEPWRRRRLYDGVAFSPDARSLAFSAGRTVSVNLYDGQRLRHFPAGGGAVCFSPDGKALAAGDTRGIIRLWELQSGRLLRTLRLDDRPADTVLVAAIQCYSKFGDPAGNRTRLAALVRRADHAGAKIVVLPETAVTGYLSADLKKTWRVGKRQVSDGLEGVDPKDAAETVPGPSTELFGKLADELGLYLTVPLLEVDPKTGSHYNTSVLLGPDGRTLLHYRKRVPWPWAERGWATPGDRGNPVLDTPFGRLGLLICYDIHTQAEIMGRLKVDTLLYSIAWVDDKDSDWFAKRLPAIAKSNGFHIVAANWTVPKNPAPKWYGYGQSRILDAAGNVLAKAKDDLSEEIIYAELPLPAAVPTKPAGGPPKP